MSVILEAKQLRKTYSTGKASYTAIRQLSLSIDLGDFVSVTGPSGCGKSTLLHLLGGLDAPDEGQVVLESQDLAALNENERTLLRRRRIGFVFQKVHLLPMLTAIENVMVPLRLDHLEWNESKSRAEEALAAVGMTHRASNRPGEMSGGECQRIAIARAIVIQPAILLADEPTGALDSQNSGRIIELFQRLVEDRKQTTLVVTHDPHVANSAHRIIRMKDGDIVEDVRNGDRMASSINAS